MSARHRIDVVRVVNARQRHGSLTVEAQHLQDHPGMRGDCCPIRQRRRGSYKAILKRVSYRIYDVITDFGIRVQDGVVDLVI